MRFCKRTIKLFLITAFLSACYSQPFVTFSNVGSSSGTTLLRNSHGSGFFDFNNDGWDDIFVVHNYSVSPLGGQSHVLYKNRRNNTFTDIASTANLYGYNKSAQGLAAADYDNDGDIDMLVAMGNVQPILYRNNGNETFSDRTSSANLAVTNEGRNAVFFDYNNDSHLDLMIMGTGSYNQILLFKNNGNGTFTQKQYEANLNISGHFGWGCALADVDNDNDIDIFFPNHKSGYTCRFFRNNGNGTFSNQSTSVGLPYSGLYYGAIFLDYNNDGWFDLYVRGNGNSSELYENDGDGTFTNVTSGSNLNVYLKNDQLQAGGGLTAGDFDNDGFVDIFPQGHHASNHRFFKNNGNGTFTDVISATGLGLNNQYYWSSPTGDYNHDGFLDIMMCANNSSDPLVPTLYKNEGNSNNWLHVKLTGVQSNKTGVGARAIAYAGNQQFMRQVKGGNSWYTESFPMEFGLADHSSVDSLVIYWPSGAVQKLYNISVNQRLNVEERATIYYSVSGTARYYASNAPIHDAVVKANEGASTTATNASGTYQLNLLENGDYDVEISRPYVIPQVQPAVSMYDAALAGRYALGMISLNAGQINAADADKNSLIQMVDASNIARYAIDLEPLLDSVVGFWEFTTIGPYNNLSQNFANQNVTGTLIGDVDGSWESVGAALAKIENSWQGDIEQIDDTLLVHLAVDTDEEILSFDCQVKNFVPNSFWECETDESFTVFKNEMQDVLRVSGFQIYPTNKMQITLKFDANKMNADQSEFWIRFNTHDYVRVSPNIVNVETQTVKSFSLNVHPNPFNMTTTINVNTDTKQNISLSIFNARGQKVHDVFSGNVGEGSHKFHWNGTNNQNQTVSTGLYFVVLKGEHFIRQQKIALIK